MKILAVSHEYPPIGGGGANAAYHLLRGFALRGHEITLITTAYTRTKDSLPGLSILEVTSKRSRADSCSFMEMLDYMLKGVRKADSVVKVAIDKNEPYDICLVFFGIPSGPIGWYLNKKYDLPYVIRFGGGDVPGFQKRFSAVYKILGPAIRVIWKNARARVANSAGLRKMALEYCSRYDFNVISNGVDTEKYRPAQIGRATSSKSDIVNILFVSRLIERKGLQYIVPMLNTISKSAGRTVILTVVGDGTYREQLIKIARDNSVLEQIVFVGEVRGNRLIEYYQGADIFILPSSNEGMPNVVLEAMACGLPIIMTPCQGSDELVKNNGFAVTIDEFEKALEKLVSDSDARVRMGAESRKLVCNQFSWDRVIDEYLELIHQIT